MDYIKLLLGVLPHQVQAVKYLAFVPDAYDTAKELTAWVQRVIAILKEEQLTDEQSAALDAQIESLKTDPAFQPDAKAPPA